MRIKKKLKRDEDIVYLKKAVVALEEGFTNSVDQNEALFYAIATLPIAKQLIIKTPLRLIQTASRNVKTPQVQAEINRLNQITTKAETHKVSKTLIKQVKKVEGIEDEAHKLRKKLDEGLQELGNKLTRVENNIELKVNELPTDEILALLKQVNEDVALLIDLEFPDWGQIVVNIDHIYQNTQQTQNFQRDFNLHIKPKIVQNTTTIEEGKQEYQSLKICQTV